VENTWQIAATFSQKSAKCWKLAMLGVKLGSGLAVADDGMDGIVVPGVQSR
jgi:hypothetical protein